MPTKKKSASSDGPVSKIVVMVVVPIVVALAIGGTSPWWWEKLPSVNPKPSDVTPNLQNKVNYFKAGFSLGNGEIFVDHGVTVRVDDITMQGGASALVGVSAAGPINHSNFVTKGSTINLARKDCDSLVVLINSIEATPRPGTTFGDLEHLTPPEQLATFTYRVIGQIVGHCAE